MVAKHGGKSQSAVFFRKWSRAFLFLRRAALAAGQSFPSFSDRPLFSLFHG